ncbi:tRNA methyl transferase-domain-containing protein [Kockovaella imperatae]|uniref:tRNA-5-taurinomethyluridine 2-sulfurtransferase n=1 Tax=Kockovaella imperatae TaxID=4999 RepID=A0A1Y1USG6_9TREE|nr:tRNA methyl transferase-domain-containing protein [Kockovaella imperatae]ORX40902.1 tRNA methyl transferase-domain-containing protein [Kockovaella imperatae]
MGPGTLLARTGLRSLTPWRCTRNIQTRQVHFINDQNISQLLPTMHDLVLKRNDTIYMAMSGGVDSSVALRILAEMPLNIHVFFMRNWDAQLSEALSEASAGDYKSRDSFFSYAYPSSSPGVPSSSSSSAVTPCGWERDWESVQRVCDHVGIPRHRVKLVDLSKEYWNRVFEPSLRIWQDGGTPNPDVACNREIKFGALVDYLRLPRDKFKRERIHVATGHYARVVRTPHIQRLCRAVDQNKDQTYFLSSLTYPQLNHAIFPLGQLTKPWVRHLAQYYGLPTASREESMGLCFVGERKQFGNFVSQYMSSDDTQGSLVDIKGNELGSHGGLWRWTIGQRAKVAGQGEALFVAKKKVGEKERNILVVPDGHPALRCTRLRTGHFKWIGSRPEKGLAPGAKKRVQIQVAYRMQAVKAYIGADWDSKGIIVDFEQPQPGVATGQVCAVYMNNWCLGSGIIEEFWTEDQVPIDPFNPVGKQARSIGWIEAGKLEQAKDLYPIRRYTARDLEPPSSRTDQLPPEELKTAKIEAPGFYVQKIRPYEMVRKREQAEIMRAEAAMPFAPRDSDDEVQNRISEESLDSVSLYYQP